MSTNEYQSLRPRAHIGDSWDDAPKIGATAVRRFTNSPTRRPSADIMPRGHFREEVSTARLSDTMTPIARAV